MNPEDRNQRKSTHIGQQARQRAAAFVGKAGERRMDSGLI
jgi:hypothetical protein